MFAIKDTLQVGLYIGEADSEVEFDLRENFVSFQLTSSISLFTPIFRLIVQDQRKVLKDSAALFDGARLRVRLATGQNFQNVWDYPLRIFHVERAPGKTGWMYAVDGYYDSPMYMSSTTSSPIRGKSSDVMASIASSCGINRTMLAPSTDDAQVWHPHNTRWAKFARDVAEHGYISSTSCMRLGMDDMGALRYVDVASLKPSSGSPPFVYAQKPDTSYRIWDSRLIVNSGINNLDSGYGHQMMQSRVHKDDAKVNTADIKSDSPLVMNATLKDQLSTNPKRSFLPIDAGNVSDNFAQARYQNERIGRTFSAGCMVMVKDRTGYQIMDCAQVEYRDPGVPNETQDNYYTGPHVITDKTLFVAQGSYYEVFRFMRNNINASPGSAK